MSKMKKTAIIIAAVLLLVLIVLSFVIVIVNDNTAAGVERELVSLPLPEKTVFVESLSKAGKLSGNGNGMQYYGAMLITSQIPLEELQNYYNQYNCEIFIQKTSNIGNLHGTVSFKTDPVPDNAYRVEKWGESPSWFFAEFDIRGH